MEASADWLGNNAYLSSAFFSSGGAGPLPLWLNGSNAAPAGAEVDNCMILNYCC